MRLSTQIYLTVSALAIIFMSKYCINYSDVTIDALYGSISKITEIKTDKINFHKNIYGLDDGLLSSTAVEDTTLTMGALYYQYKPVIADNIYINKIKINFPLNKATLDKRLSIKNPIPYSNNIIVADLIYNNKKSCTVSYDDVGEIYKISCDDFNMKIDNIGIGSTYAQVVARWGEPDISKNEQFHLYILEEGITVSILTDSRENVTGISCGLTEKMNKERYNL